MWKFSKKWFHLSRQSHVCKVCSFLVAALVKEAKICCCIGILKVFCSDQWFLYFGAEFQETYSICLFSIGIRVMRLHSRQTCVSVLGYWVFRWCFHNWSFPREDIIESQAFWTYFIKGKLKLCLLILLFEKSRCQKRI